MDESYVVGAFTEIKKYHKFDFNLKKEQVILLTKLCEKKSTFGVLPTGYGKSMCFILAPLIMDKINPSNAPHIALVVSPLRSIMKDQDVFCRRHGIKSGVITKKEEMTDETVSDIYNGKRTILFASPEVLEQQSWRKMLLTKKYQASLCLLCFDEAHCVSNWGGNFRPEYRSVSSLTSLTTVPILWLTATCTSKMIAEILNVFNFELKDVEMVAVIPDRPNIFLNFKSVARMSFEEELSLYIEHLSEKQLDAKKCIIYCRSIDCVGKIYLHMLERLGARAFVGEHIVKNRLIDQYHSVVDTDTEKRILDTFPLVTSTIRCLICTVAFGMGVQVPDIDMVIHWGTPKDILSYWQEVGRCGRDGRIAEGHLLAFLPSLNRKRTEVEMIEMVNQVKDGKCLRLAVLEALVTPGMDKKYLETLKNRPKCGNGICGLCSCCTTCKNSCKCNDISDVDMMNLKI
ncbi:bifunctional 3'-5' exonuclease/ATP-dependent helicase WRN-like [Tubulanus polymorphus]|uniref:bifunctional 3'-5' exonuclease/ATP-dependent helicase WRN-like n=1 Tax=Tubulanus polymorphus TaxID=672921 RepID=UPI003DA3EB8A